MQYTTARFKINRKLYVRNGIMPRKGADKKQNIFIVIQKLCECVKHNFVIISGDFHDGGENKTRLVIVGVFGKINIYNDQHVRHFPTYNDTYRCTFFAQLCYMSKVNCFHPVVYISSVINSNRLYTTILWVRRSVKQATCFGLHGHHQAYKRFISIKVQKDQDIKNYNFACFVWV